MTETVSLPAGQPDDLRQAWTARFLRFQQANLSVILFCRQEGVSTQAFYYWRRKLRDRPQTSDSTPTLIPIQVLPATLHILLPGGARLPLRPGCDLDLVGDLLLALEAKSC